MQVGKLYQTTGKYSWILFPSCEDAVELKDVLTLPRLHSNQLFMLLESSTLYSYVVYKVLTGSGIVGWTSISLADARLVE
jgi:hypothetical protein